MDSVHSNRKIDCQLDSSIFLARNGFSSLLTIIGLSLILVFYSVFAGIYEFSSKAISKLSGISDKNEFL